MGHNWIGLLQPKDASKPAQPGGCGTCHTAISAKPNLPGKVNEADYKNIDCLVCHAPNYRRGVVKDGENLKFWAAGGVDVLKAAQSVQKPTNEMCLRCHAATGGGPNHKHGVIPTKDSDVHVAKGMHCVDCHPTQKHKIGGGSDLKAQDLWDVKVDCTNCHKEQAIHKADATGYINKHSSRIQCQTCHIPAAARDPKMPTITARDWTKPVLNQQTGLYGPTNTPASNVKPEYRWWNRSMETPPEPVGDIKDPKSKITPWKRSTYTVIADEETGKPVFIKAGVYSVTGDPGAAAKKGAEDAKQAYSGKWKGMVETMVFSMNHQVAPKAEALKCNACHSPTGVMDFKKLGYSDEQVKSLTTNR